MTTLTEIDGIYFKREDENITGSAKDRAILPIVQKLASQKITEAVISSTGNAAISASRFCHDYGLNLTVFVSPKVSPAKLKLIQNAVIKTSFKPISEAFKFAKANGAFLIRLSTDELALQSYGVIADELQQQLPGVTNLFVPVGSGATLFGVAKKLNPSVKIFAAQPAAYCPIASEFDREFTPETQNITDALSVKLLPLKSQIISAIKNSNGGGVVVQNQEILSAQNFLLDHQVNVSNEGALALAAYWKIKSKLDTSDKSVILLTGTSR